MMLGLLDLAHPDDDLGVGVDFKPGYAKSTGHGGSKSELDIGSAEVKPSESPPSTLSMAIPVPPQVGQTFSPVPGVPGGAWSPGSVSRLPVSLHRLPW